MVLELYMYPRWGLLNVMKLHIFFECSLRYGRADRLITPPRLWDMKLIFPRLFPGQYWLIWVFTSWANLTPISEMSPSVWSSLEEDIKNITSGKLRAMLFFIIFISWELPWKPWTRTQRWTPYSLYSSGADFYSSLIDWVWCFCAFCFNLDMFLTKHSSKIIGCKFYRFLNAYLVLSFFNSAESAWPAGPDVAWSCSEISRIFKSV